MSNNKYTKYLLYAIGEILLVVIGILIALQVNNANQKRIDERALDAHLKSIVKNVKRDIKKAEFINQKRYRQLSALTYINDNIQYRLENPQLYKRPDQAVNFSKDDVNFAATTLINAWEINYLNANTGGFESLKNSGHLSKMQGSDISDLITDYYGLVNEILPIERSFNERVDNSQLLFNSSNLEGASVFFNPDFVSWDEIEKGFRPQFLEILTHRSSGASLFIPYDLIIDYNNLIIMGKELVRLIDNNSLDFDEKSAENLQYSFDKFDDTGHPRLLSEGYITDKYSFLEAYSRDPGRRLTITENGYNKIIFPDIAWSVVYFYVGKGSVEQMKTKDFSMYKTLRLELKGEKGGEQLQISIKDETNPTDGSESKVSLTLTDEWKVYDIPLSSFAPTNLKKLFMPAALISEGQATTVYCRNIQYIY